MTTKTLTPELLHKMDAYWRAANYLSASQIYLYDKPASPARNWNSCSAVTDGRPTSLRVTPPR